jgi:hypothetical protein
LAGGSSEDGGAVVVSVAAGAPGSDIVPVLSEARVQPTTKTVQHKSKKLIAERES